MEWMVFVIVCSIFQGEESCVEHTQYISFPTVVECYKQALDTPLFRYILKEELGTKIGVTCWGSLHNPDEAARIIVD